MFMPKPTNLYLSMLKPVKTIHQVALLPTPNMHGAKHIYHTRFTLTFTRIMETASERRRWHKELPSVSCLEPRQHTCAKAWWKETNIVYIHPYSNNDIISFIEWSLLCIFFALGNPDSFICASLKDLPRISPPHDLQFVNRDLQKMWLKMHQTWLPTHCSTKKWLSRIYAFRCR